MPEIQLHLSEEALEILGAEKPANMSTTAFVEYLMEIGIRQLRKEHERRARLELVSKTEKKKES